MKSKRPLVATTPYYLKKEAKETTEMLKGKVVDKIWRHRPKEIGIQFTDGYRLFVDMQPDGLELSITGGDDTESQPQPNIPLHKERKHRVL